MCEYLVRERDREERRVGSGGVKSVRRNESASDLWKVGGSERNENVQERDRETSDEGKKEVY